MNLLEKYLRELHEIRATGSAVTETSYYPALVGLLDEIGQTLKPKVRCVLTPKNQGAGIPDIGLFVARQRFDESEAFIKLMPERGVLEVKGAKADLNQIAQSEQVVSYLQRYGLVLLTNYWDFKLLSRDAGEPAGELAGELESYRLAESETEFWQAATNPRSLLAVHGERFIEYLKRVLLSNAPLESPADLAWFLASYARDAKAQIEATGTGALDSIRLAMEEALGIRFEGERGEHFFRSTLVQTLFYGIFSAWVLSCKDKASQNKPFDWRLTVHYVRLPILQKLYNEVAYPGNLQRLNLAEILWRAGETFNRVNHAAFFSRFEEEQAVQYFYEPFLEAFDPELRKQLGVWYTPPEIVEYMVARVDTVLREELNLAEGLADPNVYVLDPCCGTGAFLVEVLKQIDRRLKERGETALAAEELMRAAKERVFGFEILPAPFVVAHLQIGLLLERVGASNTAVVRAGVYLTNALTGWDPPKEPKSRLLFPELQEERDAAERVKQDKPILVVLGNPPYNAYAGVSPTEEQGLVEPYKEGLISNWGIKKFNLDDLYVRFFRLAERRIAEKSGKGVVCYVSNFSYLSDASYVVMRRRFLSEFDALWFDCLNGDSRETGKLTPDGKPDPSVFSTEYNREGIRVGTTIGLMVRKEQRAKKPNVRFRQFWGVQKRKEILASLKKKHFNSQYEKTTPKPEIRYSFRPSTVTSRYLEWPRVNELCAIAPGNGLMEKRGGALISIDRQALIERMRQYFDPGISWQTLKASEFVLTRDAASFDAKQARAKLLAAESFSQERVIRYALRPFETRWCYYTSVNPIWNRPRPALWAQCWKGNCFLMTRPAGVASPEGSPFFFTRLLGDNDFLRGHAYYFPFQLKNGKRLEKKDEATLFDLLGEKIEEDEAAANLSQAARAYLAGHGVNDPDKDAAAAELIWLHALAIGYAPAYLTENADGIRQDWPRIPLPASKTLLTASAQLGLKVAALLDTETTTTGVTAGSIRGELKLIGAAATANGKPLNREAGDFNVTAGWGHCGKEGVTMPGKGKLTVRDYSAAERAAIEQGASELGLTAEQAFACLGGQTCDVYLNDNSYWRAVPLRVWEFTIGGYQVMKKWLSYREAELLGRALTLDEIREPTNTARRIAALLLLEPELDANYQAIKETCHDWTEPGT